MPQIRLLRGVSNDLHYALRSMRRNLPFTLIFVITLSVGIGINTSAFSMINAWVWHPVSFPTPHELVTLSKLETRTGTISNVTRGQFLDWRARAEVFSHLDAWTSQQFGVSNGDLKERLSGARVTVGFFEGLEVRPWIGRLFEAADEQANGAGVVLVSYDYWKLRLGGDPQLAEHSLKLNGEKCQVVGVLPPTFDLPLIGHVDLWTLLEFSPAERSDRIAPVLGVLGRLKRNVDLGAAQAAMAPVAVGLGQEHPDTDGHAAILVRSLEQAIAQNSGKQGLFLLYVVVACILGMACVNVSNMSLAQVIEQRGQLALRLAIGADRRRLIRQVLAQNLVLSLISGFVAVGVSKIVLVWIMNRVPQAMKAYLPRLGVVPLDFTILLYALGIAILTSILSGLVPALHASRIDLSSGLLGFGRRASEGIRGTRLRRAFVGCQVGLSVVVMVVTSLMVRSILTLVRADPGFDAARVVSAEIELPRQSYADDGLVRSFVDRVTQSIQEMRDISGAGVASSVPFGSGAEAKQFTVDDLAVANGDEIPRASYIAASSGFLSALKVRQISGRMIADQDRPGEPASAVINETLARRYFPGVSPLGHHLRLHSPAAGAPLTIIGVIGDIKLNDPGEESEPQIYVSFAQFPMRSLWVVARTTEGGLSAFSDAIRRAVLDSNHDESVGRIRTLQSAINDHEAGNRLSAILISAFGILALILTAFGIYSVMLFRVTSRSSEIAIRMALGASGGAVGRMILREGCRLALIGGLIGLAIALAFVRLLAGVLYGVTPYDPPSLIFACGTVTLVSLLACAGPALLASRIDLLATLRSA